HAEPGDRNAEAPARGRRGARAEGADQDAVPARAAHLPGDVRHPARPRHLQLHASLRRLMARALVGAIFGAIVISKLPSTWSSIGYAADERTLDAIALGTYDVLKLAVMVTFTVLVLIRPSPTRVARQPLAFASC